MMAPLLRSRFASAARRHSIAGSEKWTTATLIAVKLVSIGWGPVFGVGSPL
jgi:hypothetical protein